MFFPIIFSPGQYQALSQDPNSLSNLDQDLPNNMIHQVAIKSLPQEWLWCETWCSTDTLKKAKTIDLCNNPLTKEAKLTAAQRIVPEWKGYDDEIKMLMSRIDDEQHQEQTTTAKTSANVDVNGEFERFSREIQLNNFFNILFSTLFSITTTQIIRPTNTRKSSCEEEFQQKKNMFAGA